jgi:alpha-D-ribose 1-methylphosphonate 5-triphosphate synthase subunit PhnL
VLLLDEPAAGMNPSETQTVVELIRRVHNRALRGVIEQMLTLEPVARDKAREKEERDARLREAASKYDRLMRSGRDKIE